MAHRTSATCIIETPVRVGQKFRTHFIKNDVPGGCVWLTDIYDNQRKTWDRLRDAFTKVWSASRIRIR